MIFEETKLKGAYVIDVERIKDERGFFGRVWCENELKEQGLHASFLQCNVSFNEQKGTLRGMHFQKEPKGEIKIVRCTRGAIYDVIVDVRESSPTYKQWIGVELTDSNHRMLYIPQGFAHGFITLTAGAEVFYQMSEFYYPAYASGVRWDDESVGIKWPLQPVCIGAKDRDWPDF